MPARFSRRHRPVSQQQGIFMAKRRSRKSGFSLATTPPSATITIISLILYVLGVIGAVAFVPFITPLSFWLCLAGYLLLLAGVLMKGL